MEGINERFALCKANERAAYITFTTAGYPSVEETPKQLLALQNGGAGTFKPSTIQEYSLTS